MPFWLELLLSWMGSLEVLLLAELTLVGYSIFYLIPRLDCDPLLCSLAWWGMKLGVGL
jgi:hypothetical protein